MSLANPRLAPVEEVIHGVLVRDPYRWLEDRTLPETEEWIREQQRRCDAYFAECEELPAIRERVREYLDIDVIDQPAKVGNRYFYRRRRHGQEQGSIYVRDAVSGMERLLVDPSSEGSFVSVGIHRISNDGSLLAYERRHGGEDKKEIHIVDVNLGTTLACSIEIGYAHGFAFTVENRGFYYSHETLGHREDHIIRRHLLDTPSADRAIFHAKRSPGSRLVLTADDVHLGALRIHEVGGKVIEEFWIARQDDPEDWHMVFSDRKSPFSPILKNGSIFAISYENALNGKFVQLDDDGHEVRTIVPDQGTAFVISETDVYISFLGGQCLGVRCWDPGRSGTTGNRHF